MKVLASGDSGVLLQNTSTDFYSKMYKRSVLNCEGVCGSGCIYPHFLDLGTIGGEVKSSRPGRFTPGERAPGTPIG
jgi:hypothetical protein